MEIPIDHLSQEVQKLIRGLQALEKELAENNADENSECQKINR